MLVTVDMPDADKCFIHDCLGTIIPYVTSFDTETEEIELMIQIPRKVTGEDLPVLMQTVEKEDGSMLMAPILVKFILKGAYATKDGQRIK